MGTLAIAEAKYCGWYPEVPCLLFFLMARVLNYYAVKDYQSSRGISLSGALILKTLALHGHLSGHQVAINYEPSPIGPSRRKTYIMHILKDLASIAKIKPRDEVCEAVVSQRLASVLSAMLSIIATNTRASLENIVSLHLRGMQRGAGAEEESEYTSAKNPDA